MEDSSYERYLKDLRQLNDWAMSQTDIGTGETLAVLKGEVRRAEALLHSVITVKEGLDHWLAHFGYNMEHYIDRTDERWLDPNTVRNSALVIGAGPSLTDEQLKAACDYKGTIVCCNKSLARCYRLGIVPQYVTVVHPTDEILHHFTDQAVRDNLYQSTVILSTLTHPLVSDEIMAHANKVYWYNASIPDVFTPNVDSTLNIVSNKNTVDTGGNVGIFSAVVAYLLGAKKIGLLALEHCTDIKKVNWTNEKAAEFYYKWAPEDDQFYCITPLFHSYLYGLQEWLNNIHKERPGLEIYNLTAFGPLYSLRRGKTADGLLYMTPEGFCGSFD